MEVRRRSVESGWLGVRGKVVGSVGNNSDLECRFEKRCGVESEFGKEEVIEEVVDTMARVTRSPRSATPV